MIYGKRIESSTQETKRFKIGDKIKFTDTHIKNLGLKNQNEHPIFQKHSNGLDYLTVLDLEPSWGCETSWVWFGEYYQPLGEYGNGDLVENFYNPEVFELYQPLCIKKNVKQLKF